MPARKLSNAAGLERTIKALTDAGRVGEEDEALVALARGLAAAVDAAPENAALWREYRAAVATLTEVGADDIDDAAQQFLFAVRTPAVRAEMGDTPDTRKAVDRPGGRRRR